MNLKPVAIFAMLGVLLINLFFHVWCSGQFKEISFEITKINQKTYILSEKKRELKAELSRLKSPERIERLKEALKLSTPKNSQIEILR